ncbi:MAG TPA: hypothetical protein VF596_11635 [Pyrinomonadaceae bacterium]|jgi:hypothetical protein
MSFWDKIKDGVTDAADKVASGVTDAADKVAGAADSAYDFSKDAATLTALTLGDGANLFSSGWQDVFNGDFQNGVRNIGMGMAEAVGILSPQVTRQYEDSVGQASLWALQQSKQNNQKTCLTAYRDQVKANLAKNGLQWNDKMEGNLESNIPPWINPLC